MAAVSQTPNLKYVPYSCRGDSMIEAETIVQIVNSAFTIALVVVFYNAFYSNQRDSDEPQPRQIHFVWIGPVFLCIGLLGTLGTDHTIADGLRMNYFGNGSQCFCVAYASYIAGVFRYLRIFFLWLTQYFK